VTVQTFPDWQAQPLDEVIYQCRELFEDTDFPTVRRWRDAGGKVVGHFQVYFPEELVHAAGMLPFKVRGAPVEPLQADSRFGSYLCSILKTSLELVLSERVELDMRRATWRGSGGATTRIRVRSSTCRRTPTRLTRPRTCAENTRG
jgi:hypothetical protein